MNVSKYSRLAAAECVAERLLAQGQPGPNMIKTRRKAGAMQKVLLSGLASRIAVIGMAMGLHGLIVNPDQTGQMRDVHCRQAASHQDIGDTR